MSLGKDCMTNCLFCDIRHCEWCGVDRIVDQCPYIPDEEEDEEERQNRLEYEEEMFYADL